MPSRTASKTYGTVSAERRKEMSGLEFVQGLADGTLPLNTIARTLGYDVTEAASGRVVVTAEPSGTHLNPAGTVHGGFAATLLDSCMGLAMQSTLEKGIGQTTLEFKISLVRPITPETGEIRAEGVVLSRGRRVGTAEGRITDAPGTVARPWHDDLPDLRELIVMDMDRTACYRAISTRDARFDGRLFVGVKTTGIYCRPICPARTPKFENVSFYASAAAAQEAGFRPCLRCRPEISPELAFWRGTSNTVSRALALIEAGGLDDDDVEGLRDRLGVGARQLRRLFRQHVGASPIAVAQTRRVLLAKQLIHETSLPMARSRSPRASTACAASTKPFCTCSGVRRRRCGGRATMSGAKPARCRCGSPIGRLMTGMRCCRFSRRAPFPASSSCRESLPAHHCDRPPLRRDQRYARGQKPR